MNTVDNSSVTASSRGGVGSNVKRIQSTATQVNTIRRARLTSLLGKGEVEPGAEISGATWRPGHGGRCVGVCVVGGSRLERGGACEDGRSVRIGHWKECLTEVRAIILAKKRGNSCGAKGGRKAETWDGRRSQAIRYRLLVRARTPKTKRSVPAKRTCLREQLVIIDGREESLVRPLSCYPSSTRGNLLTGEPYVGRSACPVRREGRRKPMRRSYLYRRRAVLSPLW